MPTSTADEIERYIKRLEEGNASLEADLEAARAERDAARAAIRAAVKGFGPGDKWGGFWISSQGLGLIRFGLAQALGPEAMSELAAEEGWPEPSGKEGNDG